MGGCATQLNNSKIEFHEANGFSIPIEDNYNGRPTIQLSMNGVAGRFIVDTGANSPVFTMTAVRQWHLSISDFSGHSILANGGTGNPKIITNVTVNVTPYQSLHWGTVYIYPDNNEPYFGYIDFRTLESGNAVIDTRNKTINFTPPNTELNCKLP